MNILLGLPPLELFCSIFPYKKDGGEEIKNKSKSTFVVRLEVVDGEGFGSGFGESSAILWRLRDGRLPAPPLPSPPWCYLTQSSAIPLL